MFEFYNGAKSFPEFIIYMINKLDDCDNTNATATLVVAEKIFLKEIDSVIFNRSLTVGFINKMQRVQIVLVESLDELHSLLMSHFRISTDNPMANFPRIDNNSKIIGLYGIFEHFLKTGRSLINFNLDNKLDVNNTTRTQVGYMSLEDYSGRTINHLCYLLKNVQFYKRLEIVVGEQNQNENDTIPSIWYELLPNTHIILSFSDTSDKIIYDKNNLANREITLGLILSKWMQVK